MDVENYRLGNVLRWLTEHRGMPVELCCSEQHVADAAPAEPAGVTASGGPFVRVTTDGCLALTPSWLAVDLAIAAEAEVVVRLCPAAARTVWDRVAGITAGRVRPGALVGEPAAVVHLSHPPVSRRGILRPLADKPVVPHDSDDPQERLVESLRLLGVGDAPGRAPGLALAVSGCIACGVCVRACPHDALELGTAGTRSTLVQHPDRCQAEQACVAACPETAISVTGHHDWATVLAGRAVPLARVATTACEKCHAAIPHGWTMCEACARRTEDPFGWHVPDHLVDKLPARLRDRLAGSTREGERHE